ncbi:MAG: efflux transporter outer membrane subunit [Pseudobdellovibrionaceae bacterium]
MKKILALSTLSILLSSCSLIPSFETPHMDVPARWTSATKAPDGQEIPHAWWQAYGDPHLDKLVDTALTRNLDLEAGLAAIEEARADLKIAGADLLPSADASLGAGRTRTNPAQGSTTTATSLSGSLGISYDLDLFGANAAGRDAARAMFEESVYSQEALRLVTAADVAETYFNLILTNERVRIAESNLKNARDVLHIIQVRVDNGLDSELELSQQRVSVATNEASLANLKKLASTYHNALAVLLGQAPQSLVMTQETTGQLLSLKAPDFPVSQPSVLLERRPDIASVEASLVAANANIGAARAAFFPSVTLGLTGSLSGTGLNDPLGTALGVTSALAAPIFAGGRLEGGVEKTTAARAQLIQTYKKTVLTSFKEVEDALASVSAAQSRETSLKVAMESARKAYDISRKRYEVGTIDFETLLDTQASLLLAEDTYAQALKDKLSASLDLAKALGGGWKSPKSEAPAPVSGQPL